MSHCPCCANSLLRHVRETGVYWFCSSCWQEMPDLQTLIQPGGRSNELPHSTQVYRR